MRTEEYKGRTLTIHDAEAGDSAKYPFTTRYLVSWEEVREGKMEDHGLCCNDDLAETIKAVHWSIDLYDREVK